MMEKKFQKKFFAWPRVATWHITSPLRFPNGEIENSTPTPTIPFNFFGWHNALSNPQQGTRAKLNSLFNIMIIMEQIKGRVIHICPILGIVSQWECIQEWDTINNNPIMGTRMRLHLETKNSKRYKITFNIS